MLRSETVATVLERMGPYIGGLAVLVAGAVAHPTFVRLFALSGMDGKDAASATFNVLVTLTAFLFSVFVLAIAPGNGFLQTIFHTQTFRIFKRYVVEALVLGAAASVLAFPFMSTAPSAGIWLQSWANTVWVALVVSAILAFFRVVHIFVYWVSYGSKHPRRGQP